MHFNNKIFIWWCFILFWHYFDIFLNPHFLFFLCDKHSVLIRPLWIHNIFRIHPKNLWWFPLKLMTTWITKNLTMLILNMAFNLTFVCNLEKLQVWQLKHSPHSCFHPAITCHFSRQVQLVCLNPTKHITT
jgi:hypothetical protein